MLDLISSSSLLSLSSLPGPAIYTSIIVLSLNSEEVENNIFLTVLLCSKNHPCLCKVYMHTAKFYNATTVVTTMQKVVCVCKLWIYQWDIDIQSAWLTFRQKCDSCHVFLVEGGLRKPQLFVARLWANHILGYSWILVPGSRLSGLGHTKFKINIGKSIRLSKMQY